MLRFCGGAHAGKGSSDGKERQGEVVEAIGLVRVAAARPTGDSAEEDTLEGLCRYALPIHILLKKKYGVNKRSEYERG